VLRMSDSSWEIKPQNLPTMRDLDFLAAELDAIDATLARLDQPDGPELTQHNTHNPFGAN